MKAKICWTLCMLDTNFSRWHFETFFSYFSKKLGIDISCKLRQFAWNIRTYFLEKNKNHKFIVCWISPVWGYSCDCYRVYTCRTDQNSLTFPRHKFKFPWQYWSRKFYEFSKQDTSGPNIPASSGWNVKFRHFPDIFPKYHFSLTHHRIPWPWKNLNFPDISGTGMNPVLSTNLSP